MFDAIHRCNIERSMFGRYSVVCLELISNYAPVDEVVHQKLTCFTQARRFEPRPDTSDDVDKPTLAEAHGQSISLGIEPHNGVFAVVWLMCVVY